MVTVRNEATMKIRCDSCDFADDLAVGLGLRRCVVIERVEPPPAAEDRTVGPLRGAEELDLMGFVTVVVVL